MDYMPLFFDLRGAPCLIVGGGEIALRKARLLARAGAKLHVQALAVCDELNTLLDTHAGTVIESEFSVSILDTQVFRLVVSATDDEDVNKRVSEAAQARNIPVNVVDSPDLCTVITPAIVDRSPLMIAISSGGEAPVLARKVKTLMETALPGAYGELAKFASSLRDTVKRTFPNIELRRRFWESTLDGQVAEAVFAGNVTEAKQKAQAMIDAKSVDDSGEVYLVGAGPGDPDLLTFKAVRLMQRAEVVLYDRLVTQPILDLVRKDADFVYVGKQRSDHAVAQTQINQMLLDYAQQGKRVLRLKGGDPFIFGRGAEEIELLAKHDVPFQVVPGITAASGCASYAGIPLTHRDFSQSVRFITGHVKDGVLDFRWQEFVEDSQTLVFYMGLTGLPRICEQLVKHGKSPDTPAALVERGTQPGQRVHVGCLANLNDIVKEQEIHPPTLLIIGGVVSLQKELQWFKQEN